MALFCNRCGTGLPPSCRFCSGCGAPIAAGPVIPPRPLYRPIAGRTIAGVCIALSQAYGWDVALVRIFTVIGFLLRRHCGRCLPGLLDRHSRGAVHPAQCLPARHHLSPEPLSLTYRRLKYSQGSMLRKFESDGTRQSFVETGNGPPVVFLHPTPLDHDYWGPLIENLGGIRAIVPDLRGHGASELGTRLPIGVFSRIPDAPVLTMAQLATDVINLLDHLGVAEATFAGCSIGGYVLLELWRRIPERILGLVFVCSKPQPDTLAGLDKRAATIEQIRARGTAELLRWNESDSRRHFGA